MTTKFQPLLYAEHLKNSGRYATQGGLLIEWNGIHWRLLDAVESERRAMAWMVMHQTEFVSANAARAAVATALLHLPPQPTASQDLLIPCQNGYVVLDEDGLRMIPPAAELGVTYAIGCQYEPGAPEPSRFVQFLEEVLPDVEVRARVQEYAGYSLTSDTRYQRAQMWVGRGANGKGVLANIIQALHGHFSSANLDNLNGFKLSSLVGASLIYVDEAPSGRIDENLLKSLIAGEPVLVDRKYRDPITIRLLGKWLVLGNQMPNIADQSDGTWRRWDIVPFNVQIPEERRDAKLAHTIIKTELPGVLNWALEGLMRLNCRGRFNPELPAAMVRMLSAAKMRTNSVLAWIEDAGVCIDSSGRLTPKKALYDHYQAWAKDNGFAALALPHFGTQLNMAFSDLQEVRRTSIRHLNLSVPGLASRAS
jgi:putative DNA primase/helicase